MEKLNLSLGGGSGRSNDVFVSAGLWVKRCRIDAWLGHCLCSLGKTLFCHNITLNPGVQMGNLFWKPDQMLRGNLVMDWHPI